MMTSEGKRAKRENMNGLSSPPDSDYLTSFELKREERHDEACTFMDFQSDTIPEPAQTQASSKIVDFENLGNTLKQRPWMVEEGKRTKRENVNGLSSPPDSDYLTSFALKREERHNEACTFMDFQNDPIPEPAQAQASSKIVDFENLGNTLKQRPWIVEDLLVNLEKVGKKHLDTNVYVETSLPKGVIRGCSSCNYCQKVTARWRPEEPCRPQIFYAPEFHPSEEEFKDILQYFAKIRPKAEKYGICRIVPPDSWQPPCLVKEMKVWETSKFRTHVQLINELQNLHSKTELRRSAEKAKGNKRSSIMELEYECDHFEFERGPEFTLKTFKSYAEHFKGHYFRNKGIFTNYRTPQWELVEGEYWRIVQFPTEEIQVLAGHNLEAKVLRSGFPLPMDSLNDGDQTEYVKSGWNLNNTPKLPGSLLAFESCEGSATLAPHMDVGMCFSSLCWKVEEQHLYSLSYMHLGASRIWYGIPGSYYLKCEAALKKAFPELSGHRELFHKLVTQLSPSTLKSEGIPVFRCVQHPKQFVLILPGVYHSGFDTGFNVSERVNLAPLDWLPHGQLSVEIYSELRRKTSISYDKLLMEVARATAKASWHFELKRASEEWKIACGKNGLLTRALKSRVRRERLRMECLCNTSNLQRMDKDFVCTVKRECIVCFSDLYLSAASCPCSADRYSCLEHAKQLCSNCPWSCRIFLFRYSIRELNLLTDASEGKLSALHKWAAENRDFCDHNRTRPLESL